MADSEQVSDAGSAASEESLSEADRHYCDAVRAWDDEYADRNGLRRIEWGS